MIIYKQVRIQAQNMKEKPHTNQMQKQPCINTENLQETTFCVLIPQIPKSDLKTHNLGSSQTRNNLNHVHT
jgi:hypothetical protein